MKKIKSLLFVLMGIFALSSCSDDDAPTVSFDKISYILMQDQNLEVVVNLSEAPSADVEIPYTLGGTAEKDVDYSVSSDKILVKAGEIKAKLTIIPKDNYEADRTIIINLGLLPGYDFGNNQVTTIGVTPKEKIIYTFAKEYSVLENTLDVYLKIFDAKGEEITLTKDVHIPFEINNGVEGAAVKGTHYNVKDDVTEFVIPAGSKQGKITLQYVENTDLDKNIVAISIPDLGAGFIKGGYIKTTVKVYGGTRGKMFGKWVGKQIVNRDWLVSQAGLYGYPEDADNLPEDITTDTIFIEAGEKDMFNVTMNGDAGKYFRDTEMTYFGIKENVPYREEKLFNPPKYNQTIFTLSKANVAFSADNESIKEVEVAFRVTEKDGEEILEVSIYDYEPTDFYTRIYEMSKGTEDSPVEYPMEYAPLRLHFKRVK